MQGVSLLAIGGPSYGEWARNLALSLKYYEPTIPIQIVYEPGAVRDLSPFDICTVISTDHSRKGGYLNPSYAKLCMDMYYPEEWEDVMFLDVDTLCIAPYADLFGAGYSVHCWDVTYQMEGMTSNMLWMRMNTIVEQGIEKPGFRDVFEIPEKNGVPGTNTSYQVMKPGRMVSDLYAAARDAYEWADERYEPRELLAMKWGRKNPGAEVWPDELFFNVALARRGTVDYVPAFNPVYFHTRRDGAYPGLGAIRDGGSRFLGYWGDRTYNHAGHRSTYDRQLKAVVGQGYTSSRLIKEKFVNIKKRV